MTLAPAAAARSTRSVMGSKHSITTDCRDENGITVGLVDSLISIARVLAKRNLNQLPIQEALKDLAHDEDVALILNEANRAANRPTVKN